MSEPLARTSVKSLRRSPDGSFGCLLIANRGEIACRIIHTARRMGLRTVAVHSTVDAQALHVRLADETVELPGTTAVETYLNIGAVIAAARLAGADAVHPGYGFLSENPAFVDACDSAGLVFVGPPADAMRAMGLKDAAKALMVEAGVPVVPGYHGKSQAPDELQAEAGKVGYPILIKARAGGGGKGMRRVDVPADFADALAGARREAAASFGDDRVLIEKYILGPRHVEIQIFADRHGNVVHLFERDCSLQRRHQKVIEEAPAPGMTQGVREAMTGAAVRAAAAIGYVGAGTIEFIADGREGLRADRFWFMEMNTRLQVEHPVTEAVTGIDLVEWQLRVAAGERLPALQEGISLEGHAVEARLYAEDAVAGFLPATGTLERLAFGDGSAVGVAGRGSDGRRVDSGVLQGDVVSPYYDPMLAKLIAYGPDRQVAFKRLARLLGDTTVLGTVTNRDFLLALCRHPDVLAAQLDTDLINRELAVLTGPGEGGGDAAGSAQVFYQESRVARALVAILRVSTWASEAAASERGQWNHARVSASGSAVAVSSQLAARLGLWSLWGKPRRTIAFCELDGSGDSGITLVEIVRDGIAHWNVTDVVGTLAIELDPTDLIVDTGKSKRVIVEGLGREVRVLLRSDRAELHLGEHVHRLAWTVPGAGTDTAGTGDAVLSSMPGRVIDVACTVGDVIGAGQVLVTLEAMKMEHALVAPRDGTVESIEAGPGDQVEQGAVLVRLSADGL